MNEPVLGVILAGGLGLRMGGGDKGLKLIGGKALIAHVIDRLEPQTGAIIINANGEASRFEAYGLPVIADSIQGGVGPLAGVLAGLDWADAQGFSHVVTAATDTPFFPRDLVERFKAAVKREGAELAVAASLGRQHPVFGLWPCHLKDDLRKALSLEGIRKVDVWTGRHRLAVAAFEASDYDPFFNANEPQDLAKAEAILNRYRP